MDGEGRGIEEYVKEMGMDSGSRLDGREGARPAGLVV